MDFTNQAKQILRRCLERVPCEWRFLGTCDDAELARVATRSAVISDTRLARVNAGINVGASELFAELPKFGQGITADSVALVALKKNVVNRCTNAYVR